MTRDEAIASNKERASAIRSSGGLVLYHEGVHL